MPKGCIALNLRYLMREPWDGSAPAPIPMEIILERVGGVDSGGIVDWVGIADIGGVVGIVLIRLDANPWRPGLGAGRIG